MMRVLPAAELLTIWEQGMSQTASQRALLLLYAARPESNLEELAQLSIGQRDSQLLTLREQMLGPQIVSLATCPNCDSTLELNFTVADIQQPVLLTPNSGLCLQLDGYEIEYRLPNSLDLEAVSSQSELSVAVHQLEQRCLLSAHYQGEAIGLEHIPPQVKQALVKQMAKADPQADVQIDLSCPDCGHQWQVAFDILTFFWQELTAWAQRILRDVHQLALAYGWREADILAMSPQRRQMYLEMINP